MNPIVFSDIEFNLSDESLYEKLRIRKGSEHTGHINELLKEALLVALPKAVCRQVMIEQRGDHYLIASGVSLNSSILTSHTVNTDCVFPYLATCGRELEKWAASHSDLFDRYIAGLIMEEACWAAKEYIEKFIDQQNRLTNASTINPGSLDDWPIQEQEKLFSLLQHGSRQIGVMLTESYLMTPIKSVSGVRFSSVMTHQNCNVCPRINCDHRNNR